MKWVTPRLNSKKHYWGNSTQILLLPSLGFLHFLKRGPSRIKPNQFPIEVSIVVGEPRKIAMLTMPVLHTTFDFKQISETQENEFIKTFFKYFHKGGG